MWFYENLGEAIACLPHHVLGLCVVAKLVQSLPLLLLIVYLRTQLGADPDQVSSAWHTRVSSRSRLNPESHEYTARDLKTVVPSGSNLICPLEGLGKNRQSATKKYNNRIDTSINMQQLWFCCCLLIFFCFCFLLLLFSVTKIQLHGRIYYVQ